MNDIVLISITKTTLEEIIEQAVTKALEKCNTTPTQNEKQVVDLDGLLLARPHIGSQSTLYKKVSKGLIPHSKQGKKLYFDLNEIDAWLMEHKVKSTHQLKEELTKYNNKRKRR